MIEEQVPCKSLSCADQMRLQEEENPLSQDSRSRLSSSSEANGTCQGFGALGSGQQEGADLISSLAGLQVDASSSEQTMMNKVCKINYSDQRVL